MQRGVRNAAREALIVKAVVVDRCCRAVSAILPSAKACRLVAEVLHPVDESLPRWLVRRRLSWAVEDAKVSTR